MRHERAREEREQAPTGFRVRRLDVKTMWSWSWSRAIFKDSRHDGTRKRMLAPRAKVIQTTGLGWWVVRNRQLMISGTTSGHREEMKSFAARRTPDEGSRYSGRSQGQNGPCALTAGSDATVLVRVEVERNAQVLRLLSSRFAGRKTALRMTSLVMPEMTCSKTGEGCRVTAP